MINLAKKFTMNITQNHHHGSPSSLGKPTDAKAWCIRVRWNGIKRKKKIIQKQQMLKSVSNTHKYTDTHRVG